MNRLASPAQLRASLLRWSLFLVPAIVLLGYLSSVFSGSGAENPWFAELAKPATYPPPAAFGIVWTVLYVLMGIAFAMVCSAWGARGRVAAIVVFLIQLALNLAWSPVFFGQQMIFEALILIVAIDVAVLLTVVLFWRVRPLAGALLLPYLAWVLFATLLNYQFWEMNPQAGAQPSEESQRITF